MEAFKMKSGYKTTEFWLTLLGSVAAVFVALQVLTAEEAQQVVSATGEVIKAAVALAGVLVPILGPIFYNNGRAKVKAAQK